MPYAQSVIKMFMTHNFLLNRDKFIFTTKISQSEDFQCESQSNLECQEPSYSHNILYLNSFFFFKYFSKSSKLYKHFNFYEEFYLHTKSSLSFIIL